jgi:hypothetical protein
VLIEGTRDNRFFSGEYFLSVVFVDRMEAGNKLAPIEDAIISPIITPPSRIARTTTGLLSSCSSEALKDSFSFIVL